MQSQSYELSLTTQGPVYPPSEVMNADGDFVVIGRINRPDGAGGVRTDWGRAIVGADSPLPPHGDRSPFRIVRELPDVLDSADNDMVLYTLPLPLPCNNYPMLFAPDQRPDAHAIVRPSYPFHQVPIPDLRLEDGPRVTDPITLGQWSQAQGYLEVTLVDRSTAAEFSFEFSGLIPDSMYTVMSLREYDLDPPPNGPGRPGPLGVPNAFMADRSGKGIYRARMPHPFPEPGGPIRRIMSVVLLWMSYQQSYAGAIGFFGLGGDIHAQLKPKERVFDEFITTSR
jgi:hypothetical protein